MWDATQYMMPYANSGTAPLPNQNMGGAGGTVPTNPNMPTGQYVPPGGGQSGGDMQVVPPGADYGSPSNPGYFPGNPNAPADYQFRPGDPQWTDRSQGGPIQAYPGGPMIDYGSQQPGQPNVPQTGWTGSNPWSQWPQQQQINAGDYGLYGPGGGGGGSSFTSGGNNPMVRGIGSQGDGTQYGGVTTINPQAQAADYDSVRQFSDAAYEQSRRYLDPQLQQQNRGLDQQLINQGIDPRSEYGQFMADQLARQQADMNSKVAFDALNFGQGIQQQMFDQAFNRSQLAGDLQKAEWATNLGYEGENTQRMLGNQNYKSNQEANALRQYLGDQAHQLGMGRLDLEQRNSSFDQMMGLQDLDFRQWNANEGKRRWDTQTALALGGAPISYMAPGQQAGGDLAFGAGNPYASWSSYIQNNPDIFGG